MTHTSKTLAQLYDAIQLTRPMLRHITASVEANLAVNDITVGERAILEALLSQGQITAPELTASLQLKRQFVARILAELLRKHLISTSTNPAHKRAHLYSLTPGGNKIIANVREKEMWMLEVFSEKLSESEIQAHHKVQLALNQWFSGNISIKE